MEGGSRGEVVPVEAVLLDTYYSRTARHPTQPLALSVTLTPAQLLALSVTLTPTQPLACSRKLSAYVLVTRACGR